MPNFQLSFNNSIHDNLRVSLQMQLSNTQPETQKDCLNCRNTLCLIIGTNAKSLSSQSQNVSSVISHNNTNSRRARITFGSTVKIGLNPPNLKRRSHHIHSLRRQMMNPLKPIKGPIFLNSITMV